MKRAALVAKTFLMCAKTSKVFWRYNDHKQPAISCNG